MKTFTFHLILSLLMTTMLPIHAHASVKKGKRIYKKRMYKKCGFSAVKFARHHTQLEWENIYEKGDFPKEAQIICPRLEQEKIKKKSWKDLYDFSYKYAKDGVAPNGCND
ncbi:MAG: hypothetical protein L3J47_04790 [Sulfurovum sp.]|nr:hypothetical protein [Sulfurovum sp.]